MSFVILSYCLFLLSCTNKSSEHSKHQKDTAIATVSAASAIDSSSGFAYDLKHPDEKIKLPDELTEISGIDRYKKSRIVCVNDEKGKVYLYDVKKDELKQGVDFGKKGDYEGIANHNDTICVLSSNGTIHQITGFETDKQKATDFKTFLKKENDTEGLCFDSLNHRLLIACKQDPGNGLRGVRAVYCFDLKTMQLGSKPVYVVKLDDLKNFLLKSDKEKLMGEEIKSFFDPKKGDVTFQPSEIAIHPITDEIYMISTVGKLMVVMNRAGIILHIQSLSEEIFKQPEGLCFFPNGDMYISDEGRAGRANILLFKYQTGHAK